MWSFPLWHHCYYICRLLAVRSRSLVLRSLPALLFCLLLVRLPPIFFGRGAVFYYHGADLNQLINITHCAPEASSYVRITVIKDFVHHLYLCDFWLPTEAKSTIIIGEIPQILVRELHHISQLLFNLCDIIWRKESSLKCFPKRRPGANSIFCHRPPTIRWTLKSIGQRTH